MPREIRANSQPVAAKGDGKTVGGYAALFGTPAEIGGCWIEMIERGAFTETLKSNRDVLALYSHRLERLLGRRSAGTLRVVEDDKGLGIEIDLPDTSDGRDVGVLVERGDLKGMSIGFVVTKQEWDETVTPPKRTIREAELYEVTVTADPAYVDTEIGMRSLEAARRDRRSKNFTAAGKRVAMKMTVDLRERGLASKA
jgi:uncharacterized protein